MATAVAERTKQADQTTTGESSYARVVNILSLYNWPSYSASVKAPTHGSGQTQTSQGRKAVTDARIAGIFASPLVSVTSSVPISLTSANEHAYTYFEDFFLSNLRRETAWLQEINRMEYVEDNWNGYGSEKPNRLARDMARSVLSYATAVSLPISFLLKSAQGGVSVYFISGEKRADVECLNTGELVGTKVRGTAFPDVWEIPTDNLLNDLMGIKEFLAS